MVAGTPVVLRWTGDGRRFEGGRVGGAQAIVDSDGVTAPSPVTALLLALGGCMAVDVLDIAVKMRVPITELEIELTSERCEENPRRFTAIGLTYKVKGPPAEDEPKVRRAIELSRDRYCSVWHSLKDDIELSIELELR
jgi:putative redox protein